MFTKEQLQKITTIVVHDHCPDGLASAIILHHALPQAKIKFVTYGTKEYQELPAIEGMLFCDISPPYQKSDR